MEKVGKIHKNAFVGILEIKQEKDKIFIPPKTYTSSLT